MFSLSFYLAKISHGRILLTILASVWFEEEEEEEEEEHFIDIVVVFWIYSVQQNPDNGVFSMTQEPGHKRAHDILRGQIKISIFLIAFWHAFKKTRLTQVCYLANKLFLQKALCGQHGKTQILKLV